MPTGGGVWSRSESDQLNALIDNEIATDIQAEAIVHLGGQHHQEILEAHRLCQELVALQSETYAALMEELRATDANYQRQAEEAVQLRLEVERVRATNRQLQAQLAEVLGVNQELQRAQESAAASAARAAEIAVANYSEVSTRTEEELRRQVAQLTSAVADANDRARHAEGEATAAKREIASLQAKLVEADALAQSQQQALQQAPTASAIPPTELAAQVAEATDEASRQRRALRQLEADNAAAAEDLARRQASAAQEVYSTFQMWLDGAGEASCGAESDTGTADPSHLAAVVAEHAQQARRATEVLSSRLDSLEGDRAALARATCEAAAMREKLELQEERVRDLGRQLREQDEVLSSHVSASMQHHKDELCALQQQLQEQKTELAKRSKVDLMITELPKVSAVDALAVLRATLRNRSRKSGAVAAGANRPATAA
mmetsp:Transcript_58606/g.156694  ORF Transcript_58606/g.156694 Transcript_58606/m.156694 type:complete len:434 (-) Transcript_58606:405-1706(-)